jgi:hypothetical protein
MGNNRIGMKIDYVLVVSPANYTHSQALYDLAMGFSRSLQDLGHRAELIVDPLKIIAGGKTLVLGAHLVPKHGGVMTEGEYVIFNTEQVPTDLSQSPWFTPEYLQILKTFPVWDYSGVNQTNLSAHGINATLVPIGYHPVQSNIARQESVNVCGGGKSGKQKVDYCEWSGKAPEYLDVDVAFFGSSTPRRQAVVDALREKGLVVVTPLSYGAHRDKIIARSKVLLNLHYYDTATFEIVRCAHYFANGKAVVSEYGLDKGLEEAYYECADFAEYDGVVERVVALVADADRRKYLEHRALTAFASHSQVDIIRGALG